MRMTNTYGRACCSGPGQPLVVAVHDRRDGSHCDMEPGCRRSQRVRLAGRALASAGCSSPACCSRREDGPQLTRSVLQERRTAQTIPGRLDRHLTNPTTTRVRKRPCRSCGRCSALEEAETTAPPAPPHGHRRVSGGSTLRAMRPVARAIGRLWQTAQGLNTPAARKPLLPANGSSKRSRDREAAQRSAGGHPVVGLGHRFSRELTRLRRNSTRASSGPDVEERVNTLLNEAVGRCSSSRPT